MFKKLQKRLLYGLIATVVYLLGAVIIVTVLIALLISTFFCLLLLLSFALYCFLKGIFVLLIGKICKHGNNKRSTETACVPDL